jgi:hypothetical protein
MLQGGSSTPGVYRCLFPLTLCRRIRSRYSLGHVTCLQLSMRISCPTCCQLVWSLRDPNVWGKFILLQHVTGVVPENTSPYADSVACRLFSAIRSIVFVRGAREGEGLLIICQLPFQSWWQIDARKLQPIAMELLV